jgi:tetratricopeptide (TPR) repeat protein
MLLVIRDWRAWKQRESRLHGGRPSPAFASLLLFVACAAGAQVQSPHIPEIDTGEIRTLPDADRDRINTRDAQNGRQDPTTHALKDDTCLLPPLNWTPNPVVSVDQLQIPARARKEYQEACLALRKGRMGDAEKHLRNAVSESPKYSAAWVTLGQVFGAQQRIDDAHRACSQGSIANPGYVSAYLCLADLALRTHDWNEVLKLSTRALDLDPGNNPVSYEYHAAANLNLFSAKLAVGGKKWIASHSRSIRIITNLGFTFCWPRFTKRKETPHPKWRNFASTCGTRRTRRTLRLVRGYLAKLENPGIANKAVVAPAELPADASRPNGRDFGPADIDEQASAVIADGAICPLAEILSETSKHTEDFIESFQRFSAKEQIEQLEIGKNGKKRNSAAEVANYVAQIELTHSGYPRVNEYRSENSGVRQTSLVDLGTAAFALIFHPSHVADFEFRCEGETELQLQRTWQIRFEETADPNKAFQAIRMGSSVYFPRFKGRAWIAKGSYLVVQLETDLMTPIPQIGLQREHMTIKYAPVEFRQPRMRLWLPEKTSLYVSYRGHQYERIHKFSDFQLFSVDSTEAVTEPSASPDSGHKFMAQQD